jgi:nucleoid-associated protein YgaU
MKAFQPTLLVLTAALLAGAALAQTRPAAPRAATPAPAKPAAAAAPAAAPAAAEREPTAEEKEKAAAATLAASGWLFLLDRRDWGRAWETSAAMFRATVPLAAWMDGIPKARDVGNFVEREPDEAVYRTKLEGRPDGDYVTVIYSSKFTGKEDLVEIVTTVREADGKWRVTGYSTR